jgi:predicted nucleic acid-binding protein
VTTLVDTSILIDHTRGHQRAHEVLAKTAERSELHSSEIVRAELLVLVKDREHAAIAPVLNVITWHPVDQRVAELAGSLGRAWLPSHNGIDAADFIIAATATLLGAELLTLNVKHFPMFPDLRRPY